MNLPLIVSSVLNSGSLLINKITTDKLACEKVHINLINTTEDIGFYILIDDNNYLLADDDTAILEK